MSIQYDYGILQYFSHECGITTGQKQQHAVNIFQWNQWHFLLNFMIFHGIKEVFVGFLWKGQTCFFFFFFFFFFGYFKQDDGTCFFGDSVFSWLWKWYKHMNKIFAESFEDNIFFYLPFKSLLNDKVLTPAILFCRW